MTTAPPLFPDEPTLPLEGVGYARGIARLTQAHDAYRWICGGVQVNYHTVADFRSHHGDALDELLTDHVASLMAAGVVKFKTAAQDGMRGAGQRRGRLVPVGRAAESLSGSRATTGRHAEGTTARARASRRRNLPSGLHRLH